MESTDWNSIVDELGPTWAEGAAERDATDQFIAGHYPDLKKRGLLTLLVPDSLGGGGASHGDVCRVLRHMATYDPSTALAVAMHQHLVAAQVFAHRQGTERATQTLRRIVDEDLVLVSTGARDWLESSGEMERVDGGYRLTARKAFASGSLVGDIAITSAPYHHPEDAWQVLHFGVPLSADGVTVEQDWHAHGMRSTGSHTLRFERVFVPDAAVALIRRRGEFHPVWNVVLTVAMPLITNVYVGIAEQAVARARTLAVHRADEVTVQWALGEAERHRMVAVALGDRLIDLANDLDVSPSLERTNEILAIKTATVEAARHAVEASIEATGGAGFYRRSGLEQLLRDVRAGDFHPLPERAQTLFSGRLALGLEPTEAATPAAS